MKNYNKTFDEFFNDTWILSIKEICESHDDYELLDELNKFIELKDKDNLTNEEQVFVNQYFEEINISYNDCLKSLEKKKYFDEHGLTGKITIRENNAELPSINGIDENGRPLFYNKKN